LIGDVNQLVSNNPANAAGHHDRKPDGGKDRRNAADVQPLKKRHYRSQ